MTAECDEVSTERMNTPTIIVAHPDDIYDESGVQVGGAYDYEHEHIELGATVEDIEEIIDTLIHENLHHILNHVVSEKASREIDNEWRDYHKI